MITKEKLKFIFAEGSRGFIAWNALAFIASSLLICAFSLLHAIGAASIELFFDYFRIPLIFVLNFLPVLATQIIFLCITNRQWAAFLLTALIHTGASIGNYFKMVFRGEAFMFSDLGSIIAGFKVAGAYDMQLNSRIILNIIFVVLGTALMALLARGRLRAKGRIAAGALTLLSLWPLWSFVYSNDRIYKSKTANYEHIAVIWPAQEFSTKGFIYPFIYSAKETASAVPEGYDEQKAQALLAEFDDCDIPENRRVNLLLFQLESFTDLEQLGIEGVSEEAYAVLREIQAGSISGNVMVNTFGGGTINTEHCFITGSMNGAMYTRKHPSFVWYMKEQGYATSGSHPWIQNFYSRRAQNEYLGYDSYYFYEDGFGEMLGEDQNSWFTDYLFFPQVMDNYRSLLEAGEDVFLYNLSMQGHSPYDNTELRYEKEFWQGEGSRETYIELNNYLGSMNETLGYIQEMLEELRQDEEPVVLLFYGDHKPALNNSAYSELGVSMDIATEAGLMNYYSTPYFIWANEAAKAKLGNDFVGEGPLLGIDKLMGLLFNELGWKGDAYMQYCAELSGRLPVTSSKGYYMENGKFTDSLSDEGKRLLDEYKWVQYYRQKSFEE